MAERSKNFSEEQTLIKPFEDIEASKSQLRSAESFPLVEVVHGPRQGAWFTVAYQKETTLGRAATNSVILEDNSVSRSHSVILQKGDEYYVRDIGSRNGTFVNGQKITEETLLTHLDVLKIGIYTLRFLTEATDAPFEFPDEHTPRLPAEDEVATKVEPSAPAEAPDQTEPEAPPAEEEVSPEASTVVESSPEASAAEEVPEPGVVETKEEPVPEEMEQALSLPPDILDEKPAKSSKRPLVLALVLVLLLIGGGGFFAYRQGYLSFLSGSAEGEGAEGDRQVGEDSPGVDPGQILEVEKTPETSQELALFLEVDSQPLPASVSLGEELLGDTPFRISLELKPGESQLKARYQLSAVGESWDYEQTFQVDPGDESLKVTLTPPIGSLSIQSLPEPGELYLQAQYQGQEAAAKTLRVKDINYKEPVYLPYGKYEVELRVPEKLSGSQATVSAIKYRREFVLNSQSKDYSLQVTRESLDVFPAKIDSKPSEAEVYVDGKKQGVTPYEGPLPTGRHELRLKKEGYDEFVKELSIDLNTPYEATFSLETSPAGQNINAGRKLLKKGRLNEAINEFAEALKKKPAANELSQIHVLLGEAFLKNKNFDKSAAYFQKASEDPAYEKRAKLGWAEALAGQGKKGTAYLKILEVYLNTQDKKLRREAEGVFRKMSPAKGLIYIASTPKGASLEINGNAIKQPTPVILSDLMIGSYRIHLSKPGYKDFETRVTLSVGAMKPVVVDMKQDK